MMSRSTKVIAKGMCGYRFSTSLCDVYNTPEVKKDIDIKERVENDLTKRLAAWEASDG
jgi:hypothetical protein